MKCGSLTVFLINVVQVFFPLGRTSVMIYGFLASVIFCGYIVYDTDNLIKRYTYDEYIWAAVSLYLDIINLFLSLLTIFRALQRQTIVICEVVRKWQLVKMFFISRNCYNKERVDFCIYYGYLFTRSCDCREDTENRKQIL